MLLALNWWGGQAPNPYSGPVGSDLWYDDDVTPRHQLVLRKDPYAPHVRIPAQHLQGAKGIHVLKIDRFWGANQWSRRGPRIDRRAYPAVSKSEAVDMPESQPPQSTYPYIRRRGERQ